MTCFVVSHTIGTNGAFDYFTDYLRSKNIQLISVVHPLDVYEHMTTVFSKSDLVQKKIQRHAVGVVNYLLDIYLTVRYISQNTFDTYIGANNFDTLAGIIGKTLFRRNYIIVYFASDYSENRFNNKILDYIYVSVERIALKYADVVVSNTYRAETKRMTLGLNKKKSIVIMNIAPIGKALFRPKELSKSSFIYVGNITAGSGLIPMITVLKPLIKKLVVIGDSPSWDSVCKRIKETGVRVTFIRRKSHDFVCSYLQKFSGFGLAPYDDKNNWTYYGSSLKIYDYIVTGVPVITSSRTEIAKTIEEKSLGIVYDVLLFNALKKRLDEFKTTGYYLKARQFYKEYNSDSQYGQIIKLL